MLDRVVSHITPKIEFHETSKTLINERINIFFSSRNIKFYNEIDAVNPTQLRDVTAKYFYNEIFVNLKIDDKGDPIVGYTIFHDGSIKDKLEKDSESGLCYTSIDLNNKSVFYFFYIDLQAIIDEVRSQRPNHSLSKSLPGHRYPIDYNQKVTW